MGNSNNLCGVISKQSQQLSEQYRQKTTQNRAIRKIQKIIIKPFFVKIPSSNHHHEDFPEDEQTQKQNQSQSQSSLQSVSSIKQVNQPEGNQKQIKIDSMHSLSLEEIMQMEQKKINNTRIAVNWNSFIKIKKKNYLQDYIFIKQIGKGAFGSVLKIKMKYGGFYRAAKVIKSVILTAQKGVTGKIFAQISIPMKLDHPNLIKMFEVFEWKQQYVLVMELCEGGDLFHNIKQSRFFSEGKAKSIIKQILSAINYMHKQNVCHRDIKPENILVDPESKTLKIIDFGTATYFDKQKKLRDLVGTPYYIAPEVIQGRYDQKCDIWSCGIILYILLCGAPPFNGKNQKQIMEKIRMQPLEFHNPIWMKRKKEVKDLIKRMVAKNPSQRITAQQALNSTWLCEVVNQKQVVSQIQFEVVKNLQNFHFQNKLKAVVYTYIASQLYSNKDKQKLLEVFKQIDKDGDGVIGKEELIEIFNQHSSSSLSLKQIDKILHIVDTNGSGLIDFTEFLVAASNQEKLLEEQRLQNAFNYLDADHSGFITIQEVRAFLDGTEETADQIRKIFEEVDQNGDGQISKKQFISLLLKKK